MGIIPARLGSTRLKDKPLQLIGGRPLCVYVAEEVLKTGVFDEVVVATDSEKVVNLFSDHPLIKAIMTDPAHKSGTDRIFEVIQTMGLEKTVIVNIQGDEPLIYKKDLKDLIDVMNQGYKMASVYEKMIPCDLNDMNKVKVLLNEKGEAIYFSRFPIPFSRGSIDPKMESKNKFENDSAKDLDEKSIGKHIGLYAYTSEFLKDFCSHQEGFFERHEKLEQLRALQMGEKIKMIYTENKYMGVDTLDDLKKVQKIIGELS